MNFKYGREVRQVLRPQFFTELQGRYGNMFNVRKCLRVLSDEFCDVVWR